MQDTYPKGSLLLIDHVDPDSLEVGDDITYVRAQGDTVTHRIVRIIEDADQTGYRGFICQGTMNAAPDVATVYAPNVAGRVVFHIPVIGSYIQNMQHNSLQTVVICVLVVLLLEGSIIALRRPVAGRGDERRRRHERREGEDDGQGGATA